MPMFGARSATMRSLSAAGSAANACATLAQPRRSVPRGRAHARRRAQVGARVGALRSRMRSVTSTTACFIGPISRRLARTPQASPSAGQLDPVRRRASSAPPASRRTRPASCRAVTPFASSAWRTADARLGELELLRRSAPVEVARAMRSGCRSLRTVSAMRATLGRAAPAAGRIRREASARSAACLSAPPTSPDAARDCGGGAVGRGVRPCRPASTIPAMAMTISTATATMADGA